MAAVTGTISGSCITDGGVSSVSSVSPVGVQQVKINKIDNLTLINSETLID